MTDRAKTILIGCFIIIACLSMIGVLLFLRPSVGDNGKTLYVCFTSIEKVQIGTRVTFAGKPVGEVAAIDPIYDARNQPTGRSGHVCFYELELKIDSHTVVYDTDEITMHTTGLLGERTIAIVPKAVKKGQPSYPVTDQILYGKSGDPVEETLNQIISIGTKVGDAVDQLNEILQSNKAEIPLTIKSIKDAANQIKGSFETINSTHMLLRFNDLVSNIDDASRRFNAILAEWDERGLGSSVPQLTQNLAELTGSLNQPDKIKSIMDDLKGTMHNVKDFTDSMSPEGSIAKLFRSDEIYLQLSSLMTKGNILFDDVNNYGVLFHLNKTWQRERELRINLLSQLCRPQDFRNYFDDELNRISLALGRITKSLEKARCNRCSVLKDRCFKDGFSDLLQRIGDMEERLQVYRQQLIEKCYPVDCSSKKCP